MKHLRTIRIQGRAKTIVWAGTVSCFVLIFISWKWEVFSSRDSVIEYEDDLYAAYSPKQEVDQSTEKATLDYELIRNLARIGKPYENSDSITTVKSIQNFEQIEDQTVDQKSTSIGNVVKNFTQNEGAQNLTSLVGNAVPNFTPTEETVKDLTDIQKYIRVSAQMKAVTQTSIQTNGVTRNSSETKMNPHSSIQNEESPHRLHYTMSPDQLQNLPLTDGPYLPSTKTAVHQNLTSTQTITELHSSIRNEESVYKLHNTMSPDQLRDLPTTEKYFRYNQYLPSPEKPNLPSTQKVVQNLTITQNISKNFASTEKQVQISSLTQTNGANQDLSKTKIYSHSSIRYEKSDNREHYTMSPDQLQNLPSTEGPYLPSAKKVVQNLTSNQAITPNSSEFKMNPHSSIRNEESVHRLHYTMSPDQLQYLPTTEKYFQQNQYLPPTEKPVQMLSPTQKALQYFNQTQIVPQNSIPNKMFKNIQMRASEIVLNNVDIALDIWFNKGNLTYDDALLVEYVGKRLLIPPIDESIPYNMTSNNANPPEGKIQSVWHILQNVKDGFYIDCGANSGEFISNSVWLEKEKGWNGLLIEADPVKFSLLQSKHRKAWHANVCLSNDIIPKTSSFFRSVREPELNGLTERPNQGVTQEFKVKCIPLYTILLAMKRDVVDIFSLDVEGLELDVLKTIPFNKITFKVLAVKNWSRPGGALVLKKFLVQKGYTLIKTIRRSSIFVLSSLLPGNVHEIQNYNLKSNSRVTGNKNVASLVAQSSTSSELKNKSNPWDRTA